MGMFDEISSDVRWGLRVLEQRRRFSTSNWSSGRLLHTVILIWCKTCSTNHRICFFNTFYMNVHNFPFWSCIRFAEYGDVIFMKSNPCLISFWGRFLNQNSVLNRFELSGGFFLYSILLAVNKPKFCQVWRTNSYNSITWLFVNTD